MKQRSMLILDGYQYPDQIMQHRRRWHDGTNVPQWQRGRAASDALSVFAVQTCPLPSKTPRQEPPEGEVRPSSTTEASLRPGTCGCCGTAGRTSLGVAGSCTPRPVRTRHRLCSQRGNRLWQRGEGYNACARPPYAHILINRASRNAKRPMSP